MALAATLLTGNYDNVDRASYPTASITPAANSLLLVGYSLRATTTAGTPTVSGGSLTWTTEIFDLDGIVSGGIFYAQCGASPGTFALTLNGTGGDGTWIGASWSVLQITGHKPSKPTAQSALSGGDGTTSAAPTGTLTNAIGNAGNRVFCFVQHRTSEVTNPRTNWTELDDRNGTAPAQGWEAQWRNDGTNETTFGCTYTTSSRFQMFAVEVVIAGAAGTVALAGQSDGVSTDTGAIAVDHTLAGSTAGVATTTGALAVDHTLIGSTAGLSTTAGDLLVTHGMVGQSDGLSTATGGLAVAHTLIGQSDGLSTTVGDLTVVHGGGPVALAGQSDGSSTAVGTLSVAGFVPEIDYFGLLRKSYRRPPLRRVN